ncbi:MAG: 1-phosphofructokinase family hexose kinase [Micropruina sp.]|uniref:1-phosphofructokinase family hexose kinase n=1 Tax=Micropruina sp. TaxID=2737536 RepID=UPI0039E7095D
MIITLTANPSLDRTASLDAPLARGQVQRVSGVTVEPGGKGVNVARAIHYAGQSVRAVLPAPDDDPILAALRQLGVDYRTVAVDEGVRMNLTLTEPDGTTTKINEPGTRLTDELVEALASLVVSEAEGAEWVVLSGSLPPGVPADFYATLVRRLRPLGVKVAVDTSDDPLLALVDNFPDAAPDLLKPNSDELAQLTGADAGQLEAAAKAGDPSAAVTAARSLVERGVAAVMGTLGASGAVLVTAEGAWHASPPPIVPRSTVGAGDSSVAGYVLADCGGEAAPDRLRTAVAYGSAAASMAGSALPRPEHLNTADVVVTDLG